MTAAGDAPECAACPFCQLLAVWRESRPEVLAHLADAGASLLLAVKAALESAETRPAPTVEHIDVD